MTAGPRGRTPRPHGEARTIHCDACGAPIAVASVEPVVTCTHCRHQSAVPTELLDELRGYEQNLTRQAAEVLAHENDAVRHRLQRAEMPFDASGLAIMFGPMLVLAAIDKALAFSDLVSTETQRTVDSATSALSGLLIFFGVFGYMALRRRQAHEIVRQGVVGAAETVICPVCGGLNVIAEGHVIETCGYCRESLLANQRAIAHGLSAAETQARNARLLALRSERGRGLFEMFGPRLEMFLHIGVYPCSPRCSSAWATSCRSSSRSRRISTTWPASASKSPDFTGEKVSILVAAVFLSVPPDPRGSAIQKRIVDRGYIARSTHGGFRADATELTTTAMHSAPSHALELADVTADLVRLTEQYEGRPPPRERRRDDRPRRGKRAASLPDVGREATRTVAVRLPQKPPKPSAAVSGRSHSPTAR